MIPINYHQLYYFWTIARGGSFRAATKVLLLAPSTLSLQISQLERVLGMRLLNRDRGGVSLTPEGRAVYEHCDKIFTQGEALVAMVKEGPKSAPVRLRLGVQESVSAWAVLQLIEFVTDVDKYAQVSVFGGSQAELQDRLRRHALDVVVSNFDYSTALGHSFSSRMVATLPISFVGTPDIKRHIKHFPKDIADVPLLIAGEGNPIRRAVDGYLRKHEIIPNIEIEIENTLLIRLMALQGRGAAVIDTLTVLDDLKARRLVLLHSKPIPIEEHIWILYNARPRPDLKLEKVVSGLARDFKIKQ